MKVIVFDLDEFSKESKDILSNAMADYMLSDLVCSICEGDFKRGEDAIVSGVHPLKVAHKSCWESIND